MRHAGATAELRADYAHCARIARHYENFTVASVLVPAHLRPHLLVLYAFCRGVDDLGDEGFAARPVHGDGGAEGDAGEGARARGEGRGGDGGGRGDQVGGAEAREVRARRLAALAAWEAELDRCFAPGAPPSRDPVFRALRDTITRWALPREPFSQLIAANRRDQRQRRYACYADLLTYCACSANPVGRLVLALFGYHDGERAALSDATCTALQLANFWQDVRRDLARGRIYLPEEDLARFGCTWQDLAPGRPAPSRVRDLLAFEVTRTRRLFAQGARLEAMVPRRLGLQLRLYRLGGLAVLDAIAHQGYDTCTTRPVIGPATKLGVAWRALWTGVGQGAPGATAQGAARGSAPGATAGGGEP